MLKELISNKRYSFHKEFNNWEEAVQVSCKPLLDEGVIETSYVDSIIENVKNFGPYIVIAPNICIPHAQEGKGVKDTAICFMRTEKPVHFGETEEYDARLFFVLASTDNEKHMQNLAELCELVEDQQVVEKLLSSNSEQDLKALLKS